MNYFLLRNNQESGPYSVEDLAKMGLHPMDLVWAEHNSHSWRFPTEIDELKTLVKETPLARPARQTAPKPVSVILPTNVSIQHDLSREYSSFPVNDFVPVTEPLVENEEPLKERFTGIDKKPIWHKRIFMPNEAANVAVAFVGLILGAFVIKTLVDSYPVQPEESSVATQMVMDQPAVDKNIRNALSTEIVSVPVEKPLPKPKPKDLKKQLKLKASDYKVGLFGGISDLELTVVNSSPHFVEKVTVAVKYLKKNGDVIETEFFDLTSIRPGSLKTLPVPQKKRGMKVEYKLVNVSSAEYKAALKQV